jgi:hypothetical protein
MDPNAFVEPACVDALEHIAVHPGLPALLAGAGMPNRGEPDHAGTACQVVVTHNPNVDGSVIPANPPGIFDDGEVGSVFCGL